MERCLPLFRKHIFRATENFSETRYFTPGKKELSQVWFDGEEVPFGTGILFEAEGIEGLTVGCEICEDFWTPNPPSAEHAVAGATVIVNLSASDETVGKDEFREMLVKSASAKLLCAYVYAAAGEGESTQDLVFGAHNVIAENGSVLAQTKRLSAIRCLRILMCTDCRWKDGAVIHLQRMRKIFIL